MNFEREKDTSIAIDIAKKYIKKLNLKYDLLEYKGNVKFSEVLITRIFYKNGLYACGKGFGKQGIASGLFEFLEHYLYLNYQPNNKIYLKKINEIISTDSNFLKNSYIKLLLNNKSNIQIPCLKFHKIFSQEYTYYPEILFTNKISVDDKLLFLEKYMTNSGCSIGISYFEALIHGINELVERDSFSYHLKRYFINGNNDLKVIDHDSIPKKLRKFLFFLKEEIKTNIIILEISKFKEFNVFLTYANIEGGILPIKGLGCSLDKEYALERSLLELYQSYIIYGNQEIEEDKIVLKRFKDIKYYREAVLCKYNISENSKKVYFNQKNMHFESLEKMLKYMENILNNYGYNIYAYKLYDQKDITCLKVLIPGLDNFQAISSGNFLIPND